jgi:hypothetical protein
MKNVERLPNGTFRLTLPKERVTAVEPPKYLLNEQGEIVGVQQELEVSRADLQRLYPNVLLPPPPKKSRGLPATLSRPHQNPTGKPSSRKPQPPSLTK